MPKPRVLPVPVRACPIRSEPASAIGQREFLDREGAGDADRGQRVDGLGADTELGEEWALGTDGGAGGQFLGGLLLRRTGGGVFERYGVEGCRVEGGVLC